MLLRLFWAALLLTWPALAQAKLRPLVSVMSTCSSLTSNIYPADSLNYFEAGKHAQVVFYAHLLFPTLPELGSTQIKPAAEPWHPPLAVTPSTKALAAPDFVDEFYAQAEWFDPDDKRIAFYGMTFAARSRTDFVKLSGRWYVPHTFAMAIGTRDLRSEAGQTLLPEKVGQYHVRFSVEGQSEGIAFFRMLKTAGLEKAPAPTGQALPLSPTGLPAALSKAAATLK